MAPLFVEIRQSETYLSCYESTTLCRSALRNRFTIRDTLSAFCEPSASISEPYMASIVQLKDGTALHGRLIFQDEKEIGVAMNPFDLNQLTKAPAANVTSIEFSPASLMPPSLLSGMNQDELKDLIAYLLSSGDREHRVFKGK